MQMKWFEIGVNAGGVEPPINHQRPLERLCSSVYLAFRLHLHRDGACVELNHGYLAH